MAGLAQDWEAVTYASRELLDDEEAWLGRFWSVGSGGGSGGTGQLRDGSPKPHGGHVAQAQGAPSFVGLGV